VKRRLTPGPDGTKTGDRQRRAYGSTPWGSAPNPAEAGGPRPHAPTAHGPAPYSVPSMPTSSSTSFSPEPGFTLAQRERKVS